MIFAVFGTASGVDPIIGLGPFQGSVIVLDLTTNTSDIQGLPPLDNIFRQNTTSANYFTVLLGRVEDPNNNFPGDLTIMETLSGYDDVHNQPQLPALPRPHWSVLIDEDGVIGPDGQAISVETNVTSTENKNQLTAVFDTGQAQIFFMQYNAYLNLFKF